MTRVYGAGPLHALVGLAAFALAGWALSQALDVLATPGNFVLWLAGAVVAHDLVLFPLYSLAGRAAGSVNYLRVPAALSALAFVIWFPLILGLDSDVFERTSGESNDVYLERWLLLTAALFAGSAGVFGLRAGLSSAQQAQVRDDERHNEVEPALHVRDRGRLTAQDHVELIDRGQDDSDD